MEEGFCIYMPNYNGHFISFDRVFLYFSIFLIEKTAEVYCGSAILYGDLQLVASKSLMSKLLTQLSSVNTIAIRKNIA